MVASLDAGTGEKTAKVFPPGPLPAIPAAQARATGGSFVANGATGGVPKPNGATRLARRDCGHFDIRVAKDGSWHYRGSPIGRKELVCLFASVLKRDPDGTYVLETPVERGRIEVEDAPFVAVELVWRHCDCGHAGHQQCLTFRTNLDEVVTAGASHPIRVAHDPRTGEPRPYVLVRPGLEARINRATYYELAALAEEEVVDGRAVMGVWSEGVFFPIGDAEASVPPERLDG